MKQMASAVTHTLTDTHRDSFCMLCPILRLFGRVPAKKSVNWTLHAAVEQIACRAFTLTLPPAGPAHGTGAAALAHVACRPSPPFLLRLRSCCRNWLRLKREWKVRKTFGFVAFGWFLPAYLWKSLPALATLQKNARVLCLVCNPAVHQPAYLPSLHLFRTLWHSSAFSGCHFVDFNRVFAAHFNARCRCRCCCCWLPEQRSETRNEMQSKKQKGKTLRSVVIGSARSQGSCITVRGGGRMWKSEEC